MASGGGEVIEGLEEEMEMEMEIEKEMETETEMGKSMKRRELHQSPADEIHLQRLRREKVVAMTTEANQTIAEFAYVRSRRELLSQRQSKIDVNSGSVTETGIFPAPQFNSITGQIMALCRKIERIEEEAEGTSSESTKELLHKFDYVSSSAVQKREENTKEAVKRRTDLNGKSAMDPRAEMIYSAFSWTKEDLDKLCSLLEKMESFYRENASKSKSIADQIKQASKSESIADQIKQASKSKSIADQIKQVQDMVSKFQSEVLQMLILEMEAELDGQAGGELLVGAKEAKEEMAKQEMNGGQSATGERQWGPMGDTLRLCWIDVNHETQPAMGINGKTEEQQQVNGGKAVKEAVAQAESIAEQIAALHRTDWENSWGSRRCGAFEDMTSLSPMHFTHCTPGRIPSHAVAARTLQIYSIKVSELKKWPLEVYGVVAARDTVDHNRNILFRRERDDCQTLTEKDPFLRLTGPSRAIVSIDPVIIEILLKVKGTTKSEDQVLITEIFHYNGISSGRLSSRVFSKTLGKITLSYEQLEKTVQATILGICVVEGQWAWPFRYGGRVVCSSCPQEEMEVRDGIIHVTEPPGRQVVLLDIYGEEKMPMGLNGYLDLPRRVVSAELRGSLKLLVQTYGKSCKIKAEGCVYFTPEECNLSRGICDLGDSKVEITIAWSLLVESKDAILSEGYL